MHKNSGFTLMELMTTIAIIAVLAAIAIPNMIGWRSGTKLQGAVENVRGDLQWAKLKAVQENGTVTVLFLADGTGYEIFMDSNINGVLDPGGGFPCSRQRAPFQKPAAAGRRFDRSWRHRLQWQ